MRAFVFPGQGSQHCGMGKAIAEAYSEARQVFEEADDALGFGLSRLCFEGPDEQLAMTENTQPALLTVSVAVLRALWRRAEPPHFVAGHSLGEYTALVAARSLDFADALRLVRIRGKLMQEASPLGVGAMAAVIGLDAEAVERICSRAAEGQVVSAANLNSPQQIVIAGHLEAVERAAQLAAGEGARKVVRLPVSAPFHCALMKPVQDRLQPELEKTAFADLAVPLVNNVDAALVRAASAAREGLARQVSSAVRWTDSVRALTAAGVKTFVEIGPGRVLSGLIRRIDGSARTLNVADPEQVETYV